MQGCKTVLLSYAVSAGRLMASGPCSSWAHVGRSHPALPLHCHRQCRPPALLQLPALPTRHRGGRLQVSQGPGAVTLTATHACLARDSQCLISVTAAATSHSSIRSNFFASLFVAATSRAKRSHAKQSHMQASGAYFLPMLPAAAGVMLRAGRVVAHTTS